MSPIFVRPVREQFEHDRLIRFLEPKYKRKANQVAINIGDEQTAPVKLGNGTYYPDLSTWDGRKLSTLVEVETGESVNSLEAMSQWVPFARARVPFHLYLPVQAFDVARRLCESLGARVTEIWTYRPTHDGFDLVRMVQDPSAPGGMVAVASSGPKPAAASKATARTGRAKTPAAKKAKAKAPAAAGRARKTRKPAAPKSTVRKATKKSAGSRAKAAPKPRGATRKSSKGNKSNKR